MRLVARPISPFKAKKQKQHSKNKVHLIAKTEKYFHKQFSSRSEKSKLKTGIVLLLVWDPIHIKTNQRKNKILFFFG